MKEKFKTLEYKRQYRYQVKEAKKEIIAFDTETVNGKATLITDSKNNYLMPIEDIFDILDFLTQKKYYRSFNFFYNLRYDFNAVIKWLLDLDQTLFKKLYDDQTIYIDKYTISYIPKKIFNIQKGNKKYSFFDLAQFYEYQKLDNLAKIYLNDQKKDININNVELIAKINPKQLIDYCKHDSYLTAQLGEIIYKVITEDFNYYPNNFISKANISEHYFTNKCYIPLFNKLAKNKELLNYSLESYHGGRFEILHKGYYDYCIIYDINSAYPYEIANLIDITKGEWVRINKYDNKAYYGFYKCKVQCFDKILSPFIVQQKTGLCIYPNGEYIIYLTQNEIKYLQNLFKIDVIDGWVFYPEAIYKPFKKEILKLYEFKNLYKINKDYAKYMLSKIMMNSLYGKTIEINPDKKTGNLFNPVYASIITANTRLKLFMYGYKYRDNVISFATDSIVFNKDIKINTSNKLGDFDKEIEGEGVFLVSGLYSIQNNNEVKLKYRGFKTQITFFESLLRNKEKSKFVIKNNQVLQYGQVIKNIRKYNYSDFNKFFELYKYIDVNADHKRLWDNTECSGELLLDNYNSTPLLI